jgi:hypothetical protein
MAVVFDYSYCHNRRLLPHADAPAPPLAIRGRLQFKIRGALFGSSWPEVDCEYNCGTHEFISTDSKGKQERVADCWVVDVLNSCKKQHRFDVVSAQSTLMWRVRRRRRGRSSGG